MPPVRAENVSTTKLSLSITTASSITMDSENFAQFKTARDEDPSELPVQRCSARFVKAVCRLDKRRTTLDEIADQSGNIVRSLAEAVACG